MSMENPIVSILFISSGRPGLKRNEEAKEAARRLSLPQL